jgi:hypothetical protein
MRYKSILFILLIFGAGCSTFTPNTSPIASLSTNEEMASPTLYDYEYEIVNTRPECEPSSGTVMRLYLSLSGGGDDYTDALAETLLIVDCTASVLQSRISERGDSGWKMVAFEAFPTSDFDLGVEYSYRIVWERPK